MRVSAGWLDATLRLAGTGTRSNTTPWGRGLRVSASDGVTLRSNSPLPARLGSPDSVGSAVHCRRGLPRPRIPAEDDKLKKRKLSYVRISGRRSNLLTDESLVQEMGPPGFGSASSLLVTRSNVSGAKQGDLRNPPLQRQPDFGSLLPAEGDAGNALRPRSAGCSVRLALPWRRAAASRLRVTLVWLEGESCCRVRVYTSHRLTPIRREDREIPTAALAVAKEIPPHRGGSEDLLDRSIGLQGYGVRPMSAVPKSDQTDAPSCEPCA